MWGDKTERSVRTEERGKPYSNLNLETKSKHTNSPLKKRRLSKMSSQQVHLFATMVGN